VVSFESDVCVGDLAFSTTAAFPGEFVQQLLPPVDRLPPPVAESEQVVRAGFECE
jgi:hypothetical protein